jgi:hypothetical protein
MVEESLVISEQFKQESNEEIPSLSRPLAPADFFPEEELKSVNRKRKHKDFME